MIVRFAPTSPRRRAAALAAAIAVIALPPAASIASRSSARRPFRKFSMKFAAPARPLPTIGRLTFMTAFSRPPWTEPRKLSRPSRSAPA